MSKRAEEAALKAYPKETRNESGFVIDIGHPQWIRDYYIEGYEQAEKDLALTWQDVSILITIYEQGADNGDYRRYNDAEWMKEYSQDILRKFNEIRKKRKQE